MRDDQQRIPELGNRTWDELEVIEHPDGGLLFKDEIRRKLPKGWERVPVRVRVPRPAHNVEARANARRLFAQNKDLDPERDKDMFDELEQFCLLSIAIRDPESLGQHADPEELAAQYDEESLKDVLERMQVYKRLLDPRDEIGDDTDKFWLTLLKVDRVGHLGPLTDIAGREQPSFVLRTVREALKSPTAPSFVRSRGTSTPAPSASTSSEPS